MDWSSIVGVSKIAIHYFVLLSESQVQFINNSVQHVVLNTLKDLVVQGILCRVAIGFEAKPRGKNTKGLLEFQGLCENSK